MLQLQLCDKDSDNASYKLTESQRFLCKVSLHSDYFNHSLPPPPTNLLKIKPSVFEGHGDDLSFESQN